LLVFSGGSLIADGTMANYFCSRASRSLFGALAILTAATLSSTKAEAQQRTFKLDRLEIPGGPEDGNVLFRPVTQPKPTFFGQLALGYSLNPLHTSNVINDKATLQRSDTGLIQDQFTAYATLGFQFFNRFTVAATLPATLIQDGKNPNYATGIVGGPTSSVVTTGGPSMGDMRLDLRAVVARTANEKGAFGVGGSLFAPTGTDTRFGGDGSTAGMLQVQGEYNFNFLILTANTGVMLRPRNSLNRPQNGGLGIGNEWRWAVGAFIPIKSGKFRIGGTLLGQTGIENVTINGNEFDTVFSKRNTPIEWHVEGRMKFGPKDRWWAGLGGGSLIANGYGAPDFRILGLIGAYVPILDSDANSPDRKLAQRAEWRRQHGGDADKDGIPDDLDACPNEPEDHLGSDPNDGCPAPPDRDGDGIPDAVDQCPDKPEDKDGIQDGDGCPEDDADHDGIPDVTDACPDQPGKPNPDPKKNGCPTTFIRGGDGVVRVFQQVHFKTGSAEILPDSFPMLQEITDLLKATPTIKRMSIEGHTDNKGSAALNKTLSQNRANSVMKWIVDHGVEQGRMEAHGYGLEKPIETNDTDAGRQANRRVEFKILQEDDPNKAQKVPPAGGSAPQP